MEKDKKFGDISPVGRKLSHGVVTITVIDCSEEHLQYMERYRDDGFEKQLEFVFDTTSRQQFPYFRKWMKEQKAAKQAITWGDALSAIIGTVTTSFVLTQ